MSNFNKSSFRPIFLKFQWFTIFSTFFNIPSNPCLAALPIATLSIGKIYSFPKVQWATVSTSFSLIIVPLHLVKPESKVGLSNLKIWTWVENSPVSAFVPLHTQLISQPTERERSGYFCPYSCSAYAFCFIAEWLHHKTAHHIRPISPSRKTNWWEYFPIDIMKPEFSFLLNVNWKKIYGVLKIFGRKNCILNSKKLNFQTAHTPSKRRSTKAGGKLPRDYIWIHHGSCLNFFSHAS